jgi:glutathione S-transferase
MLTVESKFLAVQAEQTLRAKLAILEDQLAKTPFLGGDTCNMADSMVARVLQRQHTQALTRSLDPSG